MAGSFQMQSHGLVPDRMASMGVVLRVFGTYYGPEKDICVR